MHPICYLHLLSRQGLMGNSGPVCTRLGFSPPNTAVHKPLGAFSWIPLLLRIPHFASIFWQPVLVDIPIEATILNIFLKCFILNSMKRIFAKAFENNPNLLQFRNRFRPVKYAILPHLEVFMGICGLNVLNDSTYQRQGAVSQRMRRMQFILECIKMHGW